MTLSKVARIDDTDYDDDEGDGDDDNGDDDDTE